MNDIDTIKQLRSETGAGVLDVKKSLEEAGGDTQKARVLLQERGAEIAQKKASRDTRAGVVHAYIHSNNTIGVLVTVLCETDFVARNNVFQELAHDLAMHIAAMDSDPGAVLSEPFVKDTSITVQEVLQSAIAKLGENIEIGEFVRYEL